MLRERLPRGWKRAYENVWGRNLSISQIDDTRADGDDEYEEEYLGIILDYYKYIKD